MMIVGTTGGGPGSACGSTVPCPVGGGPGSACARPIGNPATLADDGADGLMHPYLPLQIRPSASSHEGQPSQVIPSGSMGVPSMASTMLS